MDLDEFALVVKGRLGALESDTVCLHHIVTLYLYIF